MYGKGVGAVNTAAGVSLLPSTGDNKIVFAVAIALLISGVAILAIATIANRKSSQAK